MYDEKQSILKNSKLILRTEVVCENRENMIMNFQAKKLMNTDGWFDKSDPFIRFLRLREDNTYILVHETEKIMDNLNPIWY